VRLDNMMNRQAASRGPARPLGDPPSECSQQDLWPYLPTHREISCPHVAAKGPQSLGCSIVSRRVFEPILAESDHGSGQWIKFGRLTWHM
jgi:hypothetical protein